MTDPVWQRAVCQLSRLLTGVSFQSREGTNFPADEGFDMWAEWVRDLRCRRRTVFLVGNGASASMASHFAADLAKNAHVHTEVFSDLALLTAVSNDMGYAQSFAEPLRRRGQTGDMLVAISSSGRSSNVICAVDVGRRLGMRVITLSAMDPTNDLRVQGDLNIHIAGRTYGEAETCHAAVLHHWMDRVVSLLQEREDSVEGDN